MKLEEFVEQLEKSTDYVVYYDSENKPDYAINTETNEMIIFSYGYSYHATAKSMDDLEYIDCSENIFKKHVFDELDNRIEKLIDKYNRELAHYTRCASNLNSDEYSRVKGALNELLEFREELSNKYYW